MANLPIKRTGKPWYYKKYRKKKAKGNTGKETFVGLRDEQTVATSSSPTVIHYENIPGLSSCVENDQHHSENTGVHLSDLDMYIFGLKSHGTVVTLSNLVFALQDVKSCKLQLHKFKLLEGRVILVNQEPTCIWACSCDTHRRKFIKELPEQLGNFTQNQYPECIHVQAIQVLLRDTIAETLHNYKQGEDPGNHGYAKTLYDEEEVVFQQVAHHFATTAVYSHRSGLGIVAVTYPLPEQIATLCCHCCMKSNRFNCEHIALVKDSIDTNPSLEDMQMYLCLEKEVRTYEQFVPCSENSGPYPFFKDETFSTNISEVCDCGYITDVTETPRDVPVYGKDHIYTMKVCAASCSSCHKDQLCLSTDKAVMCMTHYGIEFDVLWDFAQKFVTAGLTMFEYFKMWQWDLHMTMVDEDLRKTLTYARMRFAILCFIHGVDISEYQGFLCPECGKEPKIVIFDGMTLAFRKQLQLSRRPEMTDAKMYDGSQHTSRVFVNNSETRKMLLKFCESGLEEEELLHLQHLVQKYQGALNGLLADCVENHWTKPPASMCKLLKDLSRNVPVSALLHPSEHTLYLVQRLVEGHQLTAQELAQLHSKCPFITETLQDGRIPDNSFSAIITAMIDISKYPYKEPETKHAPVTEKDPLGYYPSLPELCQRGQYISDNKLQKKEAECEKRKPRHPSLLPGVFSLLCPHGICYGFDIMDKAESPNCAFTCLRTRFRTGPEAVIYDNSCHLHSYSLNRCTKFFEKTWFLIDRLHWRNHTGCSRGYNIEEYSIFTKINSQVAEQRHAQLKKLKTMLSYMDSKNFQRFLAVYTWFHNSIKICKLQGTSEVKYADKFKVLADIFQRI